MAAFFCFLEGIMAYGLKASHVVNLAGEKQDWNTGTDVEFPLVSGI